MAKEQKQNEIFDSCPHCGQKLSPWQQVLLSVDRALTCKNCWYRIILNPPAKNENKDKLKEDKTKLEE
jgi:DNA-directed RNA polymerase subunit RPC12/RpoP